MAELDAATLSLTDFARAVKGMRDDELRAAMAEPAVREAVLDRVVEGMQEQFRPERAKGVDAVVHWKVFDRPGGGYDRFELVVRDGAISGTREPRHEPDVELKADPVTFAKALTGTGSTTMLAVRGKLRVKGDLNLARKIDGWFVRPKA